MAHRRTQGDVLRDMAATQAATAQILLQIQETLRNMNQPQQNVAPPVTNEGNGINKLLNQFRKANPPSFHGEYDPEVAERWVRQIEKIFGVLECTTEQRVTLATYMLEGEAELWWKSARRLLEARDLHLTWELFVETFYDKYFPENVKNQKEAEFLTLRQGDMTAAQFEARYEELSKFSKYLKETHDEAWKAMNYERCLRPELRDRVATLEIRDFAKLANKVRIAEETLKACNAGKGQKTEKRGFSENFRSRAELWNKRQKGVNVLNQKNQNHNSPALNSPTCNKCGRNHGDRPCRAGQNVCYVCGKPGHYAKQCRFKKEEGPISRPVNQGRVFTLSQ